MTIQDTVARLLAERRMSQAKLSRLTGIPASTLNRYLKQGADMPVENAKAIAVAFDITIDELLGLPYRISREEARLVECYRSMSPRFRAQLISLAESLADNGQAKNNQVPERAAL